jgi:methylmalonyl-CoA mutase C-terminal domain/subunit
VKAAVEENVDFVGLSTLSGNHMELVPVVVRLMREAGIPDIPVLLGGTVPPDDVPKLKAIGVDGIFGPGTALKDIVGHIARRA